MIALIIIVVSTLASALTGIFVYVRNSEQTVNRIYGLLTVSLVLLSVANYLSLATSSHLFYIRAVIFFASIFAGCLYYLIVFLDGHHKQLTRKQRLGIYFTAVVAVVNCTPLVFSGVKQSGGSISPIPNVGAPLFIGQFIVFLAASCLALGRRLFNRRDPQRPQYMYMLIGALPIFLFAPVTSIVMPIAFKNDSLIVLSPAYGAFFVCLIGYAIIRHKLFDIRLTIARTVAYLLSLGFIGLAYGAVVFAISSLPYLERQPKNVQRIEYVFLALITALLYPWVRRFFARVTDRILYQDSYDPQVLLGELNQSLVNNIQLNKLLTVAANTIANSLKAEYCLFGIKETGFKDVRIFGTTKKEFDPRDVVVARHSTPHLGTNIIVADFLPPEAEKLKHILVRNDIAMLVRLVPEFASNKDGAEGLGYILLGRKRSGNAYTTQDIRVMGIIANELVIAIQNALHFEEIQRFNVTLQEKVDVQTRELRRKNQKLIELDETKDDFISMASHQLRTPLTSVKGYLSMVLEGDAGKLNETQMKMLGQAFTSSQRMVFLITDLLNVSRLKTGKFVIDAAPVDLSTMIQSEIAQLTEAAQAKNLQLAYQKPAAFPKLMLDETKTRQVIMNFIDNAIYYTPEGGHIRIELADKPATVELRVIDDGIGVPKGEQHHLFTKFYRAANARKARPDGTGLGLFMAKKVIIAQGGSVLFESKENQGSTFGFVFSKSKLKVPTGTGPEKRVTGEAGKALAVAKI